MLWGFEGEAEPAADSTRGGLVVLSNDSRLVLTACSQEYQVLSTFKRIKLSLCPFIENKIVAILSECKARAD